MGCAASSQSNAVHPASSEPLLAKQADTDEKTVDSHDTAAVASTIVITSDSDSHTSPHGQHGHQPSVDTSAPPSTVVTDTNTTSGRNPSSSVSVNETRPTSQSLSAPAGKHRHTLSQTEDRFSIIKVLGEGASCKVVAVRERRSGHHYAMKIMDKSEPYNRVLFDSETGILKAMQHENILQYVESYEDKNTYHLLTVLCQGGELFDRVKNGSFSEKVAASLCRQMLSALAYCHGHGVVHRDLKPENFVFATKDENSAMKLIDFGCAKIVDDTEIVSDVAGSPYYCAPEILGDSIIRTGLVWKASDMWSVGVIVFLLVCGFPPFNGDSQEKIFRKIRKGRFRFPKPSELSGVQLSDSVQDLIISLLKMNPMHRLTAHQALEHPWITGLTASETPLPEIVIDALSSFRAQCRLKKAAARVLLNKMTEDDRANLKQVFSQFDVNGDGQLGPEEVTRLMHMIGKTEHEAKAILDTMDDDGDGGVSLGEFEQAAALGQLNTEEEIKRSFDMFDLDHDGFITQMEIERVCGFLTTDAANSMVQEVDTNSDGRITFDEWLLAMTGRSQLKQHREQLMQGKRRSMQLDKQQTANELQKHAQIRHPSAIKEEHDEKQPLIASETSASTSVTVIAVAAS